MPTDSLENAVDQLRQRLGCEWPAIAKARRDSSMQKQEIQRLLDNCAPADTSIVTFGSLAREEWTSGSDLDWTLLIDGEADPQHLNTAQRIAQVLHDKSFKEPGPTGLFGNMAFSHDIVHRIGGQEDTNRNITQRILLLLESWAVGKSEAYDRVVRHILKRYLDEDYGLKYGSGPYKVPRFLLNDIVRYWRTITVDFVYKQPERPRREWALRNAKLRMSRKLIFVSGLLTCFSCDHPAFKQTLSAPAPSVDPIVAHLQNYVKSIPLNIVARALLDSGVGPKTSLQMFDAYNAFLELLDDVARRNHLEALSEEKLGSDSVFKEVRKMGRQFQGSLTKFFFREDSKLRELTEEYGVF